MPWVYDDGGRKKAGYKGVSNSDCVCRAIAIATGRSYNSVKKRLCAIAQYMNPITGNRSNPARGVYRETFREYLNLEGWEWVATMRRGSGCTVHLRDGELPCGRLIVRCSKHLTCVVDGIIHDNHNPSRSGTRCVYGYWIKKYKRKPLPKKYLNGTG